MGKHKCNSCGYQFDGDDFVMECPSCGSKNLSSGNSDINSFKIKNFFQENMKVSIILGVIIVIISIIALRDCDGDKKGVTDNEKLELKLKTGNNFIVIKLIDKNANKGSENLDYSNKPALYSSAGFEAYQNSNRIVISKGIIYPCESGTIKLIWKEGFGGMNHNSKIIKFTFKNKAKAHEKALCKKKLEVKVLPDDCKCKVKITTNYDTLYPNAVVMISITGKKGPYKDQRIWELNETNPHYKVYAYSEQGDTVQANDFEGKVKGCVSFNPAAYEQAAKDYANNPQNNRAFSHFKELTKASFKLIYNGRVLGDINDLGNKLRTASKNNNNATFNVAIKWVNKGKCKDAKSVKSVSFSMK